MSVSGKSCLRIVSGSGFFAVCFVDMEADDFLPQLRDVAAKLESSFQDMCDLEFTIEDGKLFVLLARSGKRTPIAALRIATDLFLERKITGKELVRRIEPTHIEAILKPSLVLNSKLRELGTGLPASPGAATGTAAFSADVAFRLGSAGTPVVFLCVEMTPDDIHGVDSSSGMISFVGGMSSHAAVCARGMGKPCVSATHWSFDRTGNVITPRGTIREGDPLTIDGTAGIVYAGSADIEARRPLENERLVLLLKVIDVLAAEGELPREHIGKAWLIRDVLLHGSSSQDRPDPEQRLEHWPVGVAPHGRSFSAIGREEVQQLSDELFSFRLAGCGRSDYVHIWHGLRTCFLRLLSKHVGVGRHPEFLRPLFDPYQTVLDERRSSGWKCASGSRLQVVEEEFFSINSHVPELIDIATIRMYWAVECDSPLELWRIDRTNPAGEKLLRGSSNIRALKIVVNDGAVGLDTLPPFFNALRRREYYWAWYRANKISRREILDEMSEPRKAVSNRMGGLARSAGILSELGDLTAVGKSLVFPATARERRSVKLRIGW